MRLFRLEGPVVPYARHVGVGKSGHNPARYAAWRDAAAYRLRSLDALANTQPLVGDASVRIVVDRDGVTIEVDESPRRRPRGVRGDIDNLAKAVLDALVDARVITDDRHVVALSVEFADE